MSMSTKEPEEARPSHLHSRHDRFTYGFPVAAGLEQPGRAASWEKVELTSYTSSPERFCSSRGLPLPCPHLSGHSSVFCPRVALPNPPGCDAPPAAWCLGCLSLGEQQGLLTSPRSSPAWQGAMNQPPVPTTSARRFAQGCPTCVLMHRWAGLTHTRVLLETVFWGGRRRQRREEPSQKCLQRDSMNNANISAFKYVWNNRE